MRLPGEDLIVARTTSGKVLLIRQRCPHRGASLLYGFLRGEALVGHNLN
ncbi:Rieske 2Fe-2S domain-containing protein [Winslowiella toletana]